MVIGGNMDEPFVGSAHRGGTIVVPSAGDDGGKRERGVNLGYSLELWVSSLYIKSTLTICIYLYISHAIFFLYSWSRVTLQPQHLDYAGLVR
jgi:hypothetical protein